jgi:signal transduction histidine kinase/CheY-like chemotaxis protein
MATLGLMLAWLALCWLAYRLVGARRQRLARLLFMAGFIPLSLAPAWLTGNPDLLFAPVLGGPLAVALFPPGIAVAYAAVILAGQVALGNLIAPDSVTWLPPLLSFFATALALIGNANVNTILGWAETSIVQAANRLDEVREHRAELSRSVKALNEAVQRLERANAMLAAARAEAEEARQARNQFALTVSHELRSPLNFIIGFSELMVNAPETYGEPDAWPPGLYQDVQAIYRSSNHLLHLVNDILDLGRADAQRLLLVKERVAPAALIEDAVAIMRPGVEGRGLTLRTEIEAGLPELLVDRTRIRQVLINLLNNALRFTEQGGMTLAAARCEDGVLFSVADTGPGIPPEGVAKVFEEFGQVGASVWRRRDGSGLGVPISQRFVATHGGRLWLTSEVGKGTTFYFTLPLPGMSEPEMLLDGVRGAGRWPLDGQPAPRLVALLARNPAAAEGVAACVEGYRVVGATSATDALRLVARQLPQALLIDAALAEEPEIAPLLAALPYDLPVITLNLPGGSGRVDALPPGVADYLVKPVMRDALAAAVGRLARPVRRLLVIDDDPEMARYVALALTAVSAQVPPAVLAAACGGDALALLGQMATDGEDLPDAIMLDLNLPDMAGWDVLAALQAWPALSAIPVLLITAASLPEELDSREPRGVRINTRRPLNTEELGAVLAAALGAIRPRFPAGADASARPEDPSA